MQDLRSLRVSGLLLDRIAGGIDSNDARDHFDVERSSKMYWAGVLTLTRKLKRLYPDQRYARTPYALHEQLIGHSNM